MTELSNSEWNFPLILGPKSDGTMEPPIEPKTMLDRLPLPVIPDIMRSLETENTPFSTRDIRSPFGR